MDIAEKMAADIALAMDGGEWKDGKWYSKFHRDAWIKAVKPYADEIERLRGNMYQAMHHAAEIWKENGQELDDQLGVVALILANGLGIISDAALKEGE